MEDFTLVGWHCWKTSDKAEAFSMHLATLACAPVLYAFKDCNMFVCGDRERERKGGRDGGEDGSVGLWLCVWEKAGVPQTSKGVCAFHWLSYGHFPQS